MKQNRSHPSKCQVKGCDGKLKWVAVGLYKCSKCKEMHTS